MKHRVVERHLLASRLKLDPGKVDQKATESLAKMKLLARSRGDLNSAVLSAGYYAKKLNQTMFVYSGNSYGHGIWRVSYKPGDYLDPINNTGSVVLSVTPDLEVSQHKVQRSG